MVNNKKYLIISCHVLWRELSYFAALSENIFNFLEQDKTVGAANDEKSLIHHNIIPMEMSSETDEIVCEN